MSVGALTGMMVSGTVLALLVACDTVVEDPVGDPVAVITAEPMLGPAPLEVVFTGTGSHWAGGIGGDPAYCWDFGDGGGSTTCDQPETTHTYLTAGMFQACLEFGLREDLQVRDTRCVDIQAS